MNLPKGSFDSVQFMPKQSREIQLEKVPEKLPAGEGEVEPVTLVLPKEKAINVSFFQSMRAIPLDDGTWARQVGSVLQSKQERLLGSVFLSGNKYIEDDEGLNLIRSTDETELISSAKVRLVKILEQWQTDKVFEELLHCEVRCKAWGDVVKHMYVPIEQYKQIYQIIHKKYPDVLLTTDGREAIEEYLTDIVKNGLKDLPRVVSTMTTGWMTRQGRTQFYIGSDPFYSDCEIPDVRDSNRYTLFRRGSSFVDIGKGNAAIGIIWLFAHIGYSLIWLKKAGVEFRSVLFLKGGTNLLKTSVAREISNVFDRNRNHAVIRIASTLASLQYNISMLRDQTVCLDDFSNSEQSSKNKAVEAAEDVIRAVGDGVFPTKMSTKHSDRVARNVVRSGIILTGEEELGLGASSNYRTIMVPIVEGCFDGGVLTTFQKDQSIIRNYFALYLQFLEEHGDDLASGCGELFFRYRAYYEQELQTRRLIDAAAGLRLLADFVLQFASYCGVGEAEKSELMQLFERSIMSLLQQHQENSKKQKPEVRFLYALMQSIDTGPKNGLAKDEETYVLDESQFIGFHEKKTDLIWVRFESAWDLVVSYYKKQGEQWLTKPLTIKELLLRKDISVGKKVANGNKVNEYVCKSKKFPRRHFLVLRKEAVEELLKEEGE